MAFARRALAVSTLNRGHYGRRWGNSRTLLFGNQDDISALPLRIKEEVRMLVLSRKKEEVVVLSRLGCDDDIEIKVVEVSGGKVRLGIAAPADVKILRKELLGDE